MIDLIPNERNFWIAKTYDSTAIKAFQAKFEVLANGEFNLSRASPRLMCCLGSYWMPGSIVLESKKQPWKFDGNCSPVFDGFDWWVGYMITPNTTEACGLYLLLPQLEKRPYRPPLVRVWGSPKAEWIELVLSSALKRVLELEVCC